MTGEGPPGLAEQRTVLSWQRTAIGCALLGAGGLKLGISRGQVLEWVAAGWLLALAALLGTIALARRRTEARVDVAVRRRDALTVAAGMVVAAVLVVAAVVDAR